MAAVQADGSENPGLRVGSRVIIRDEQVYLLR